MSYYSAVYQNTNVLSTKKRYFKLQKEFEKFFGACPQRFFSSPGRCELLGNHTDHNNGKVLVAAITYDIIAAASPNGGSSITLLDPRGILKVDISHLEKINEEEGSSLALIRGVCAYFKDKGFNFGGFDCALNSALPSGSGLSSSAAFELLIAQVLSSLFNGDSISPLEKAKAGKFAENVYFNKPCGLLDQCGVALGGVTYIDFKNVQSPQILNAKLNLKKNAALIVKTQEDHSNLTEHYGQIKEDMRLIAQKFNKQYLGEVSEGEFYKYFNAQKTQTLPLTRAYHFFEENKRVLRAYEALCGKDSAAFFEQVKDSGLSSRYCLKNCALPNEDHSPVEQILDYAQNLDKSSAVRVHGGGFRGGVLIFTSKEYAKIIKQKYGKNCLALRFRQKGACEVKLAELFPKEVNI